MNKNIFLGVVFVLAFVLVEFYVFGKKGNSLPSDSGNNQISKEDTKSAANSLYKDGSGRDVSMFLRSRELVVSDRYRSGSFSASRNLDIPDEFSVGVFAAGLGSARGLAISPAGDIFVTDLGGRVLLLRDSDGDGVAEDIVTVDQNLNSPHGIDIFEGNLYIGEEHQVVVYLGMKSDGKYDRKEILIPGLPSGQGHATRTVKIGPDRKIYVHVGSSCNVCEERDARRATILRYNLDGTFDRLIGRGLRNTVGFSFKNIMSGFELWGVDNGRDRIGDNLPPEEVNLIWSSGQEEAKNFGWPYCYGKGIANPEYLSRSAYCQNSTEFPHFEMQAHSAPLGIAFIPEGNENFPMALAGNMLISFHGSWNRSVPTGYKVVRIDPRDSGEMADFITGWLGKDGKAWGRPVDVAISSGGTIYISDDQAGAVYRVSRSSE